MKGYRFAILTNGRMLEGRFRVGQLVRTPYGSRKVVEVGYEPPCEIEPCPEIAFGVQ